MSDKTSLEMLGSGGGGSSSSSNDVMVSVAVSGEPTASQIISLPIPSDITITLPEDLTNSRAYAETAPSGGAVAIDIQKNAVSIGTITFADGENEATFTFTTETALEGSNDDRLRFVFPATLNSIANVGISLRGTKS